MVGTGSKGQRGGEDSDWSGSAGLTVCGRGRGCLVSGERARWMLGMGRGEGAEEVGLYSSSYQPGIRGTLFILSPPLFRNEAISLPT